MKKLLTVFAILLAGAAFAQDTLRVYEPVTPLLINRTNNPYFELSIKPTSAKRVLQGLDIEIDNPKYIKAITLYYTGNQSLAKGYTSDNKFDNPSYAVKKLEIKDVKNKMTLTADQQLFPANNYFWIGVTLDEKTPLTQKISVKLSAAKVNNKNVVIDYQGKQTPRRVGVSVRNGSDDGVAAYRIPGIVTTKKGTLIAVYDIRRNSSVDLQEDIQVGVSRSFDGGATWQPMQIALDMRGYGVLPDAQNGVGDPAILVDDKTGDIIVIGLWSHGIGGLRNFWNSKKNAMQPEEEAAQVVIARSSDDGATWSKPLNITPMVKKPEWGVHLQGPGMGITMKDGTLVFAYQYLGEDNIPKATIISSKDGGKTWKAGSAARENTTEAQVAEIAPGVLMLNMRDNRGGSRAILTTTDLGKTWTEHSTSRSALIEPVCMASFIKADDNIFLFSNPADTKARTNMTIKGSKDKAQSWNEGVMIDNGGCWGYSCLTMIDPETVGILYEGSQSQMTFQAIPLNEILENK
ncbi:Sialidase [Mucinivorans hirudinis]|uniref:exo-alpha-sialidase n=1 Tax=Mucinivorans hirudinis TaxID=1433126 RepID=A0A060R6P5_9BACT|nr:Sialidase [Mucinivorans hirudinis]